MEERLAHEVEIEKPHLTHESGGKHVEFVHRHRVLRPRCLRAEHTIKVAHIRYFKIASGYHVLVLCVSYKSTQFKLYRQNKDPELYIYARVSLLALDGEKTIKAKEPRECIT